MHKKNLRFLSLALAIGLMVLSILPTPVEAAALTKSEINTQIKTTYKKVLKLFRRNSLDGYCGAYVSGQLQLMGINTNLIGGDGKDQYDTFKNMKMTSGGYRVRPYPASVYSLQDALNHITDNGTQNAYNILVGFQKTRSAAGKRYGHAVVIHAIIDGTVYFSESYSMNYKGKFYKEGSPITMSISDFCSFYAATTTQLDGVIYFGLKSYTEGCKLYPTGYTALPAANAQIRTQPCQSDVHESSEFLRTPEVDEVLLLTGLYENTVGEFWYQINGGVGGYIPAEQVQLLNVYTDDVRLMNMKAPTALRQGRSFNIQGAAVSNYCSIGTLRAQVYQITENGYVPVINATASVDAKHYSMNGSKLAKDLTFRKLAVGQYRLEIAAIVSNAYVENGAVVIRWDTVGLWSSDFQVTKSTANTDTVVFDANGGTASLNQTSVPVGTAIGYLPTAQRVDHVFLGWYTEQDGGVRVFDDFIPDDSTTLYARWSSIDQINEDWQNGGECWYYYSDGLSSVGCIEIEGTLFYFSTVDPLGQSDLLWTGAASET